MSNKANPNVIEPIHLEPVEERELKTFSYGNAAEMLDEKGLVDAAAAVEDLSKATIAKVEDVASDLFDFLEQQRSSWREEEVSLITPFSSLASGSLRGDSACSREQCRAAKLGVLARYAAMYADHVFLPVALTHPSSGTGAEELRESLTRTVFSILELRPLVERGLVRPVMPVMHYCPECGKHAFEKYSGGMAAAKLQASKHLGEFDFVCQLVSENPEILALEIHGPEDYVEHGTMFRIYLRRPEWLPRPLKATERYKVPTATARRAGLVEQIFSRMAADVCFHQGFQDTFNATYLTDLPGEAEFLKTLSSCDALAMRTAAICSQLSHELPMLTDVPIRTVLKIRDENPESFEAYRSTLGKLVREHVGSNRSTTEKEAKEIYRDVLEPILSQLRVEAQRQHSLWLRKSLGTAAFAIGVVSLRATGVLQSQEVLSLLGGATIKGLVDQLSEAGTEPVTSSNLYFLLRLEQEGNKRRADRN
jgi:hypothetical protein